LVSSASTHHKSTSHPTFLGENVNKEIRGRCIGTMQLFK
jgi:hypothetical protein